MKCQNPKCGAEMEKNKHGVHICPKCGDVYMEKKAIDSIYGVHR